ncbi:MAG: hypothetical protein Q8Q09_28875 [Deltaproteobacteria bacterium]|nr:hypothetical protein [Deltaproteobacteria bacterium]
MPTDSLPPKAPDHDAQREPAADLDLEPVGRDSRFVFRLVSALILGAFAALVIGAWMRGAAANCGSKILQPGATVIPASGT